MSQVISNALKTVGECLIMALVVIIPVWFFIRGSSNEEKKRKALLKKATPGDAKIIEVGVSRTSSSDNSDQKMHVALRLEVVPRFGEQFNAITYWAVEPAHTAEIQAGKSVPVKIAEIQVGKSKTKKNLKAFFLKYRGQTCIIGRKNSLRKI